MLIPNTWTSCFSTTEKSKNLILNCSGRFFKLQIDRYAMPTSPCTYFLPTWEFIRFLGKFEFSLIQVLNEVGEFCVALQVASIWIVGTVHRSLPYRRPGLHRWPKWLEQRLVFCTSYQVVNKKPTSSHRKCLGRYVLILLKHLILGTKWFNIFLNRRLRVLLEGWIWWVINWDSQKSHSSTPAQH